MTVGVRAPPLPRGRPTFHSESPSKSIRHCCLCQSCIYAIMLFLSSNISSRKFCSTSVIQRHRPLFETPLPSPSFSPSSPIQRLYNSKLADSPTLFKEAGNRLKTIISQKLNFDDKSDEESDEQSDQSHNQDSSLSTDWDKSFNIGPKNLLDV